jgi:hypothetical protein
MNTMYATVIRQHGSKSECKLVVAARVGSLVVTTNLNAMAPDYESARAEAQAKYPDRTIVVPKLQESVPA